MASLTKYAGTISQSTGGKFAQFSNLANMKNATNGSWATTTNIKGKSGSPNRPSTLSFTGFGLVCLLVQKSVRLLLLIVIVRLGLVLSVPLPFHYLVLVDFPVRVLLQVRPL